MGTCEHTQGSVMPEQIITMRERVLNDITLAALADSFMQKQCTFEIR